MKKTWIALLVLAMVAAAGGVFYYRSTPAEASSELITAAVTRGDVVETVQSTGSLEAVTTVQVGSQVSGSIKALHADFNSQVRRGEVIAELDPSLFQTQVEQARATLLRLQAELDRAKVQVVDSELKLKRARDLSARQLVPQADLETAESVQHQNEAAVKSAEAQIVQARASLNQAQVNLDYTIIKAPIDGIVVTRNVDVGQTVAASMQAPVLFVIAKDLTAMQVSASVDEADIGRIRPGEHVTFRVDAYPDDRFRGTVQQVRLQPVVTQNVVSYTTIIAAPNPDLKLRQGMTATVTVEIARADGVLRVPSGALRFRPTPEVFAQLGQAPPAGLGAGQGGFGGRGPAGPGTGTPIAGGSAPPNRAGVPGGNAQSAAVPAKMPATPPATASGAAPMARDAGRGAQAGADATAAQDARGGQGGPGGDRRGRFADMTPEQRQQMRERMQGMSPEERRAMRARFGGQGGAPGDGESGAGDVAARPTDRGAAGGRGRGAGQAPAPEAPRITTRPVWVLASGKLERRVLSVSISDGAMTAVVGGPLEEGALVVTGVTPPKSAAQGAGNPFMPFGGRPPGGQGGRPGQGGGNAGGGGGARPAGGGR